MRARGRSNVQFDHHSTSKEIGARIKKVRISQKLTQPELGEILGMSYQQIQKYESGSSHITVARLIQLCAALDVPLGAVLIGSKLPSSDPVPSPSR